MLESLKVALITGAARRLGAEIACLLHASGFNVALHYYHSKEDAAQLAAKLNKIRPHSAVLLAADLNNISALDNLVKQAAEAWGGLQVLINNASRFYKTTVGNVTENIWEDLLASNLKAPFFLCQAAKEYLQTSSGCIVNIADVHAKRPMRDYSVYCIAKAGLVMLTKTLAKELGPNIRVNAVAPGAVMWPEGENVLSATLKEKIIQRTVLRRVGLPRDVAQAVAYLVNGAEYVTGTVLTVDGGRSLTI